jgi:rRNA maturation endonuclease Nob1
VSSLQTRIAELERMLGRCRDCKTIVELVEDSSPKRPPRVEYCRGCGQPLERITVRLSFDPGAGGAP